MIIFLNVFLFLPCEGMQRRAFRANPLLGQEFDYQIRLKMDLKLMEHHEHHFPTYERRFNCLIPPPQGYKVSRLSFLSFFSPSPHLNLIMSLSYKVAGVGSYTHHMNIYLQAEPLNLVIIHYVVKMSSACRFRFDLATRK